jgi:hypothetical protein
VTMGVVHIDLPATPGLGRAAVTAGLVHIDLPATPDLVGQP